MPTEAGPETRRWVEEELLVQLEGEFRCARPGVVVPMWMREAGFQMGEVGMLELDLRGVEGERVEERLEGEVGRWLLSGQYPFVKGWCWEKGVGGRWRVLSLRGVKS